MNGNIIYYICVLSSAFFGFLAQYFSKDKYGKMLLNRIYLVISFLILLIFVGFRECGVGIDDYAYKSIFEYTCNNNLIFILKNTNGIEIGYLFLNYVVGLFTNDVHIIFFILSFISLYFVYKTIVYQRKNVSLFLSILFFGLLIYPYYFGILRLSVAISISFYAFCFFKKNDIKKYNVLIFIAFLFHRSACVMFIFNLLIKNELKKEYLIKLYIASWIIIPIVFIIIGKMIVPILDSRYANYQIQPKMNISIGDFDKIPFIFMMLFFYDSMKNITDESKLYIFLYSYAFIISICSNIINLGRMEWYFNIFICLNFPILLRGMYKNKIWHKTSIFIFIVLLIYSVWYSIRITAPTAKNVFFDKYENILLK